MECGHPRELLDAYLDAELDAAGSLDVERHLGECSACSAIVTRHRALREALRAPELSHRAPAELRTRLENKLRARRSRFAVWRTQLGAIAAGLLMTLTVGYALGRWSGNGDRRVEQEVVAAHVRSLQAKHLVDVESSDRHTVKPWFAGKIDFAPIVADFANQGFTLVGGRLDYLDGRPAAALVFKRREHFVNVFLQPKRDGDAAPRALEQQGFHLLHAVVDGFDCWLISDTGDTDLRELLRLIGST